MLEASALLQAEGVAAEKFAADADDADLARDQRRRQVRADAVFVFTRIEIHDLWEERIAQGGAHHRIIKVDALGELKIALADFDGQFLAEIAADGLGEVEHFAAKHRAELLITARRARIRGQIARRALQE